MKHTYDIATGIQPCLICQRPAIVCPCCTLCSVCVTPALHQFMPHDALLAAAVRLTDSAIETNLNGDADTASKMLSAISRLGEVPVYAAFIHTAAILTKGMPQGVGPGYQPTFVAFGNPELTVDDAPFELRFIGRFVTAYLNRDVDTASALYRSAREADVLVECYMGLFNWVTAMKVSEQNAANEERNRRN